MLCFLYLQGPVMPGSHSVERFVIEENLHCIIKTHWKERKTWWVAVLVGVTPEHMAECLNTSTCL